MGFFGHISSIIRFMQLPRERRRVVFYSEGPAYWVHLDGLLQRLLEQAEIPVCYFSSDPRDPGLALQHANLHSFEIDAAWVRDWLFVNIDADLMVLTTPDLHQHQLKRSRHAVHYVYVQHSLVSQHMAYRPGAFDHFDTVFCAGPHHVGEIRALERQRGTHVKNLVEHGYQRLDSILAANRETPATSVQEGVPHVLIAPSWGPNGIIELLGNAPIDALLQDGLQVTLRPHPQTLRLHAKVVQQIVSRHAEDPLFQLDDDVSSSASLHASDVMISDWSGAALDYAFGLDKPVVFIDTPRKTNNPAYTEIGIEPFEAIVRPLIGDIVAADELAKLSTTVRRVLGEAAPGKYAETAHKHVYNVGRSAEAGADALLAILAEQGT